jgi:5-oxoprolinase (ATP-hydrolysing)/N-methylhydantoinase A
MASYLYRLRDQLKEMKLSAPLFLMMSGGGLTTLETAARFPIRLVESGPAGGAILAAQIAAECALPHVLSFDMGGTTAKATLIEDGRFEVMPMLEAARVHRFTKGSGLPIKTPVIDMIEIGAGGGSIAAIDSLGLLKVGPHSAGSAPGPACYGLGGTEPTVTDACLLLGYYDPDFFLGGAMDLDLPAAERAMRKVADPLGLSVPQAAWGIHALVVDSMAAAARVHLVEHGRDPRSFSMVGFGGAGPAHQDKRPGEPGVCSAAPGRQACPADGRFTSSRQRQRRERRPSSRPSWRRPWLQPSERQRRAQPAFLPSWPGQRRRWRRRRRWTGRPGA